MYPILVTCITGSSMWTHNDQVCPDLDMHNYPYDRENPSFARLPLLSYCRTQCWSALVDAGLAPKTVDPMLVRWRAAVPFMNNGVNLVETRLARLELYIEHEKGQPFKLLASYPICGKEFDALPLVVRLGIELLWRKECNGHDTE